MIKKCITHGCNKEVKSRNLCNNHYAESIRSVGIGKICSEPKCDRPSEARGLCVNHYGKFMRDVGTGKICSEPKCERPARSKGLCAGHYQQTVSVRHNSDNRFYMNGKRKDTCGEIDCDRPVSALGLCTSHYQKAGRLKVKMSKGEKDVGTIEELVNGIFES